MTTVGAVSRTTRFHHLTPADLRLPPCGTVFFDPIDTEVGIWAAADLLDPGATVLDLGSGSGAAAAALARAGAGHVHGVDIAADSVSWAADHYAREGCPRVTFSVADYSVGTTHDLLARCPFQSAPAVVTSNPPYVPLPASPDRTGRVSIDGGPDGLRLVRHVVRHASTMDSRLAVTIGSYTTPRAMIALLLDFGYRVTHLTLGALPLGEHTAANRGRVAELAATGEGPLIELAGVTHYLVAGLSCQRVRDPADHVPTPDDILALLRLACTATTPCLETLDGTATFPVRVVVLSDDTVRLHP
ncbi:methyltransferase family protein [Actinophytocola oryzae]|uniref:Methyltransferase family protein n=1 Tax=Actinophytocola oryzae TaxID=502181 RepID=A0A4R7VQ74_9PSEU|nr:methyltransferase family protein [Actinophytocola oryzae]